MESQKLNYTVVISERYYSTSAQSTAVDLAWKVLALLTDHAPDRMVGPVPNADYVGNRFWKVAPASS